MAWVPTLLVEHGFSLVHSLSWSSAMSIGSVPGPLIAAIMADRWERKWSITVVALTLVGCGLLYGMTFKTVPIIIFGFLVTMLMPTFGSLLYAYTPEAYPTEIRNSGVGLTYALGRLANVAGEASVRLPIERA
jgi:putative MFS transporter